MYCITLHWFIRSSSIITFNLHLNIFSDKQGEKEYPSNYKHNFCWYRFLFTNETIKEKTKYPWRFVPVRGNMELTELPVTIVIKAPNQRIGDHTVECMLGWTVKKLKNHLAEVYPSKPVSYLNLKLQMISLIVINQAKQCYKNIHCVRHDCHDCMEKSTDCIYDGES